MSSEGHGGLLVVRACTLFIGGVLLHICLGCSHIITAYWAKPGFGEAELKQDIEECEGLQRAAGVEEWRIHGCLEAKGWVQKRETVEEQPLE